MTRNLHSITVRMNVRNIETTSGRTQQAVFSELESDMSPEITNELPLVIHALTITAREKTRKGFDYTLGRFFLS